MSEETVERMQSKLDRHSSANENFKNNQNA